jgi:hypothetical protein
VGGDDDEDAGEAEDEGEQDEGDHGGGGVGGGGFEGEGDWNGVVSWFESGVRKGKGGMKTYGRRA